MRGVCASHAAVGSSAALALAMASRRALGWCLREPPDSRSRQKDDVRQCPCQEADVIKKVLFLSSANSARSQIAEAFLRALAGEAFEVCSAGSLPRPVDCLAIAVMAECGIDIGG